MITFTDRQAVRNKTIPCFIMSAGYICARGGIRGCRIIQRSCVQEFLGGKGRRQLVEFFWLVKIFTCNFQKSYINLCICLFLLSVCLSVKICTGDTFKGMETCGQEELFRWAQHSMQANYWNKKK